MTRFAEIRRRAAVPLVLGAVGIAIFALVYGQAPLYYSNQNQYFLHGLADAGVGQLREDWLANTSDPTPLFSGLVAVTVDTLHPWAFYLYYALLLGVYAAAMLGLFVAVAGREVAARRWPVFVALFAVVHAALLRWASSRLLGNDYPWFLLAGVAGQYVLGAMFQPSAFGIFLVAAVCLFTRGRPFLAAACVAVAGSVHSTYLLPGAMLVCGFLIALAAEGEARRALAVGALALVLVLPISTYTWLTFGPTAAETFAEAQGILARVRIPHHTQPDLWLDEIAALQIVWAGLGVALTRPPRLRLALAIAFLLGTVLTLAQVATDSDTLALLFPWRISAVLVPVATTVILARTVTALPAFAEGGAARAAAAVVCLAGGVWIGVARLGFQTDDAELPLLDFVRQSLQPGDLYFLPVKMGTATRGSLSSDFKPLAAKQLDPRVIPVNLQRFRLATGAPIFIDFKAIPYKDTEVLEWYKRLRQAEQIQHELDEGSAAAALAQLRRQGITHVVRRTGETRAGQGFEKVHEDARYQVFRLRAGPA